jgi:hypothetical protein
MAGPTIGRGTGHGGEVVTEQHVLVGRDEVVAVLELVRRRQEGAVERVDLRGQVARVVPVAEEEHDPDDSCDDESRHAGTSRLQATRAVTARHPGTML